MIHATNHHEHSDYEHAHHHTPNCGCGHEHHNHTDHHDHSHDHHEGPIEITQMTHDGAAVVTAQCTLSGTGDSLDEAVRSVLLALATWTSGNGGVIGHIKAALTKEMMTAFSVTDTVVNSAPQKLVTGHLYLAAITYMVEPTDLAQKMQSLLSDLPLLI